MVAEVVVSIYPSETETCKNAGVVRVTRLPTNITSNGSTKSGAKAHLHGRGRSKEKLILIAMERFTSPRDLL